MAHQRIMVGDTTYELRRWSYEDGSRWLFRLGAVLLPVIGAAGAAASDTAAVITLVQAVDVDDFVELRAFCEDHTSVVIRKDGKELVQPLSDVLTAHMRALGPEDAYFHMLSFMKAHCVAQFAGFFAKARGAIGGPEKGK